MVRDDLSLSHVEKWMIRRMLVKCRGNRLAAATVLGMSRWSLYRRINLYQEIDEHDPDFLAWAKEHPEL